MPEFWNVNCGDHKERAHSIPHVMLFIKFGIRSRPKVHLMLAELIEYMLDTAPGAAGSRLVQSVWIVVVV